MFNMCGFFKKTIYINIGAGVSGNVEYQESFCWFQFWGFWQLFEKPCCTLLSSAKILDPLLLSTFSTTEYAVRFSYYPDWHFWWLNEAWMCNGCSQKMIRMWPKSCLKHDHFLASKSMMRPNERKNGILFRSVGSLLQQPQAGAFTQ